MKKIFLIVITFLSIGICDIYSQVIKMETEQILHGWMAVVIRRKEELILLCWAAII